MARDIAEVRERMTAAGYKLDNSVYTHLDQAAASVAQSMKSRKAEAVSENEAQFRAKLISGHAKSLNSHEASALPIILIVAILVALVNSYAKKELDQSLWDLFIEKLEEFMPTVGSQSKQ